jgi:hypothetical protein
MKALRVVGAPALALCLAGSAYAHHTAAGIDRSSTVTVDGTVLQFRWANPHSWIELEVQKRDGVTEIWNLEMLPPSYLVRAGWTRSTITAGDRVKVVVNGFINGDPGGIFVSITLPDGRTLAQRPPRPGA